MAIPTKRPWAIKPPVNQVSAASIVGPDQSLIVTFKSPETTSTLIGGILTQTLTTLGGQQATLNDVNARYLTRAVNAFDQTLMILQTLRTMLDPAANRTMPREQVRKQLYQQVQEVLTVMEAPL